jgi:hypothetical protein
VRWSRSTGYRRSQGIEPGAKRHRPWHAGTHQDWRLTRYKGVVVEKLRRVKAKERWTPIRAKGWAVMSRWDVEKPSIDAFLYVPDPNN